MRGANQMFAAEPKDLWPECRLIAANDKAALAATAA
jgi:hypothetical protein